MTKKRVHPNWWIATLYTWWDSYSLSTKWTNKIRESQLRDFGFVPEEEKKEIYHEPVVDIVELVLDRDFTSWKTSEELCEDIEEILKKHFNKYVDSDDKTNL